MKHLDGIIVPSSGSVEEDLVRARKAVEINEDKVPYIISGVGPDTDRHFNPDKYDEEKTSLDYHSELYAFFADLFHKGDTEIYGIGTSARTSRENLIESFPQGIAGRYAIVSDPLHLLRFKFMEKIFKLRNLISRDVVVEYVPTKTYSEISKKDWARGLIALAKDIMITTLLPKKLIAPDFYNS